MREVPGWRCVSSATCRRAEAFSVTTCLPLTTLTRKLSAVEVAVVIEADVEQDARIVPRQDLRPWSVLANSFESNCCSYR